MQFLIAAHLGQFPMFPPRLFCAWNEWSVPHCDGSCGQSATMITRTLGGAPQIHLKKGQSQQLAPEK